MLAVVKSRPQPGIDIIEVPKPQPMAGEVLIAVEACGICGTDVHFHEWPQHARWITLPRILGHEVVGRVAQVGCGVKGLEKGQRVVTETWGGCGLCHFCRLGRFNFCETQRRIGQHSDGGMTDYVVVPAVSLYPIADTIDTAAAALLQPLALCVHALERVAFTPGDRVVILGPGPIGLLATQLMARSGAATVVVAGLEKDTQRLAWAEKWGGTAIQVSGQSLIEQVLEMTAGRGVDLVLDMAGGHAALATAVDIVKPGGQVLALGLGEPGVLDCNRLVTKEIRLIGCFRRQPVSWQRAIDLLEEERLQVQELVTHRFSVAEAEQGFRRLIEGKALKVLIVPRH